jgi:hypothetical protein
MTSVAFNAAISAANVADRRTPSIIRIWIRASPARTRRSVVVSNVAVALESAGATCVACDGGVSSTTRLPRTIMSEQSTATPPISGSLLSHPEHVERDRRETCASALKSARPIVRLRRCTLVDGLYMCVRGTRGHSRDEQCDGRSYRLSSRSTFCPTRCAASVSYAAGRLRSPMRS